MPVTRCAVVVTDGSIQNIIMADAERDKLPDASLIALADDQDVDGYVWNGSAFEPGPELAAQIAAEQAAIEAEAQETE